MIMEWSVSYTFEGQPSEDELVALQEKIDGDGWDGSVAADPDAGHWSVSFGADATFASEALQGTDRLLDKVGVHNHAIAVEVMTVDELERRANLPTMPPLIGASEVADMLGVKRQRVHQLSKNKPDFPIPLVHVAMGPLWDQRAIDAFDRHWTRQPGRPARASASRRHQPVA